MLHPSFCKLRTRLLKVYFYREQCLSSSTETSSMAVTPWRVHRRRSTCGSSQQSSSTSSPVHMTGSMSDGFPQWFVPSNTSSHSSCCCSGSNHGYLSAESDCQINGCQLISCGAFTYNPVQILTKVIFVVQEPLTHGPGTAAELKQWQICRERAEGRLELLPTQLEEKRDTTKLPSLYKY